MKIPAPSSSPRPSFPPSSARLRHPAARRWALLGAAITVLFGSVLPPASIAFADDEGTPLPPTVTVSTPATADCAQRVSPAPAADTPEDVVTGSTAPAPLSVPPSPVGGKALGQCGIVVPRGTSALPPDISAAAWMVADLDTGDVLAAKDPHGRYRPASTLKLLTMNVLLRSLTDVDRVVVGTDADTEQQGSRVGIGPGGRYTVRQLMLFLMMGSGNDVAHALAVANGGVKRTLTQMNSRARALGAFDTRAATVSGLDGAGQSTSAYDLALIARSDMKLPPFPELVTTKYSEVPGFGEYPAFGIANDNALLWGYAGALGGKNGYTDAAGNTYVGMAERGGRRLVVTMLGGTQQPRRQWMQGASLLDWGFAQDPGVTPIGFLVASGAQATASAAPDGSSEIPVTGPSGTLTFGATGGGSGTGASAAPIDTPSEAAVPAAASGESSGIAIVVWIVLAVLAALAVLVVVAGLRGSGRRGDHD